MAEILSPNTGAVIGYLTPDSSAQIGARLDGLSGAMADLAMADERRTILSRVIEALDRARHPLGAIIVA
jgi:acyl-CoA reductase-like NAD-dependent aldehyde dehydrogenase